MNRNDSDTTVRVSKPVMAALHAYDSEARPTQSGNQLFSPIFGNLGIVTPTHVERR